MDRRSADAIAAFRRDWEEAVQWYRRATVPQSPSTAHAGWEGGRILEVELVRGTSLDAADLDRKPGFRYFPPVPWAGLAQW